MQSDQQALFRAITAAPDDDAPRLVYADWLDENGQAARAEFIRVQCALAREEKYSPAWRKLDHREKKLFDYRWQKHMKGKALHCVFARGFIDRITIFSKRLVETADELFELEPIQVVKLGNIFAQRGNIGVVTLASSDVFRRLRGLDLSLCTEAPHLVEQLGFAKKLRNLRELTCCSVNLDVDHLLTGLLAGEINQLEALTFDTNAQDYVGGSRPQWDVASFQRLATWPGIKTLKTLALHDVAWTPARAAAFAAIPFAQLECLDLSTKHFSNFYELCTVALNTEGLQALVASPHLATLKELHVPQHGITSKGIEALAQSPHMKNLRRLNLQANGFGLEGMEALLASPHITGLYYLNLDYCGVVNVVEVRKAVKNKFPDVVLRLS